MVFLLQLPIKKESDTPVKQSLLPQLLEQVKVYDATIPVVTFGSHVATDILRAAQEGGADAVMPRSQFTVELPNLLRQYGGATT